MSQIVLPLPVSRAPLVSAGSRPSISPASSCKPSRELLTAWVLFLLARQGTYGYELHRQLETRGMTMELGAMYRVLRKLEHEGYAASSWASSVAGPQRRLYELTATGRRELGALVHAITATRDVHAAFLRAHGEALGRREPPQASRA